MAVISNQNVDYFVQILESSIKIKSSLKIKDVTLSCIFIATHQHKKHAQVQNPISITNVDREELRIEIVKI